MRSKVSILSELLFWPVRKVIKNKLIIVSDNCFKVDARNKVNMRIECEGGETYSKNAWRRLL